MDFPVDSSVPPSEQHASAAAGGSAPPTSTGQPGEGPKKAAQPLPDSPPSFMAAAKRIDSSQAGSLLAKRKSEDAQGAGGSRMRSSSVQPPSAQHTRVLMASFLACAVSALFRSSFARYTGRIVQMLVFGY